MRINLRKARVSGLKRCLFNKRTGLDNYHDQLERKEKFRLLPQVSSKNPSKEISRAFRSNADLKTKRRRRIKL